MILCEKDGNVGLDLPKSLFPVDMKYASTVGTPGFQSIFADALNVIQQILGVSQLNM